jgi:hypothetical protein
MDERVPVLSAVRCDIRGCNAAAMHSYFTNDAPAQAERVDVCERHRERAE